MEYQFPGADVDFDSNLISGYLTAFKDFGSEVSKGKGELKVINMDIFNLVMVMKKNIFIAGAADKRDDAMVVYHDLNVLVNEFLIQFKSTLLEWRGEISVFKRFDKTVEEILKDGKKSELKQFIPILKIYKKDFLQLTGIGSKKGLIIKQEDFKDISKQKEIPEGMKEKRLPTQVLAQGFLSDNSYKIAHLANGFNNIDQIIETSNIPSEEIFKIIETLDQLGLLDYIEIN